MSSTSQDTPTITVEVPNKPLPLPMRLASLRVRPGPRSGRRSMPGLTPVLPVVGLAGMALTMRRRR